MKLLIVSDVHANWPALEAVIAAEPDFDDVAFCGDVVDYGPNPVECIHWLERNAAHRVRGNHDNALAFGVDCRCMGSCREFALATMAWHDTLVVESDREFLRELPVLDWFEWQGKHFRMAHATPQGDMFEYLRADQWESRVSGLPGDFIILGHTHVQGLRTFGDLTVVNPGSVGLARDGGGEACYAVYDGDRVTLKRIAYDVERTVKDLRASPLPRPVVDGLSALLRP